MSNEINLQTRVFELEGELARLKKVNEALMNRVEFSTDKNSSSYNLFENNILLQNKIREHTSHLVQINNVLQQEVIERKATEINLRQEKGFLSSVFDFANVWIIVFDRNLNIVRINHTCEKATGLINDDVKGTSLRDLYYYENEDEADVKNDLSHNDNKVFGRIKPIRLRNGKLYYIAWTTSTITDLNNTTEYIVSCGYDFTENVTL